MSVVPVVVGLAVLAAVLVVYLTGRKHGKVASLPAKPKVEDRPKPKVEDRPEKREHPENHGKEVSESKRAEHEHGRGHDKN